MKKMFRLFAGLLMLMLSTTVQAQTKTGADYFQGKWDVLVKALPQGDTRLFVVIEKKDSSFTGAVLDSTGNHVAALDKVELMDTTVTVYFYAQGYDVNLVLNKKDDDHVVGNMMGMFEAEGDRVKVVK